MKFKVGDRVRASFNSVSPKVDSVEGVITETQDFLSAPTYRITLACGARIRRYEDEIEPIDPDPTVLRVPIDFGRTATERRLIEALRPAAERALAAEKDGWKSFFLTDDLAALKLLRELGEYPETCKTCGQEIRHDT